MNREFKNGYFYFAPGLTFTLPAGAYSREVQVVDTTYRFNAEPAFGKVRYAFEVGWYHSFDNPVFFHYLDIGLAYRSFSGNSELSIDRIWDGNQITTTEDASYKIDQASFLFRAIRAKQLGRYTFLTYGPGINFDYHFSDDREIENEFFESNSQDFKLQLHLQLGLGIRLTEGLIFQPQIELPLLELYEFGKWTPYHEFANGDHYPFLLSFRFMFLRKDLMNCNAPTFN